MLYEGTIAKTQREYIEFFFVSPMGEVATLYSTHSFFDLNEKLKIELLLQLSLQGKFLLFKATCKRGL